MESQWIPETLESDFRGQNSMDCGVIYIIGKLLEHRCLKWARIVHLKSETQVMAKRKVGSQIGILIPNHKKSGIDPISVCADGVRYTVGKFSTRATTFLQTSS
jgi:hypothetical protein